MMLHPMKNMNGGLDVRLSGNSLQPSEGTKSDARSTFSEVALRGDPQYAVQEVYEPQISQAIYNPSPKENLPNVTVLPPRDGGIRLGDIPPVTLLDADGSHAYARLYERDPISLAHHGPGWGAVFFAVMYPCVENNLQNNQRRYYTFQSPGPREARQVAIKQLKKSVVREYLQRGGMENPYKEIARMQELGDNIHVLQCVAMEDDDYLFIITPKACELGTLKDIIPWLRSDTLDPEYVKRIFKKLLDILLYLENHGICHRDLSPDNFIFLEPNRLVAFDLALSLRVPKDAQGHRTLLLPQGCFGTPAWMSPEIYANRVYDSVGSDLWSVAVILFNLLTSTLIYKVPHVQDVGFRYFLVLNGIASNVVNERTFELLHQAIPPGSADEDNERHFLKLQIRQVLNLDDSAVELLGRLLRLAPHERCSLAEAYESAFLRGIE